MKLTEIRIQNFRSFKDATIPLDNYTCLVGPNGSGKSAVLMALNVLFRDNDSTVTNALNLAREDFHHENVQEPVRITLAFEELPDEKNGGIVKCCGWDDEAAAARDWFGVSYTQPPKPDSRRSAPLREGQTHPSIAPYLASVGGCLKSPTASPKAIPFALRQTS